jgi:uncharacterized membrane protein YdjX (TVP38/TMEM64 family)
MKWIKTHKKQLMQLLIALGLGILVSFIFFLIFFLTGVIQFDNGFVFNKAMFDELKDNPILYLVYVLIAAGGATLLCMNPIGSGVFVWLGIALFGANWKCFLATFSGCLLSYIIIDAFGRFGGSKLIIKIFGKEEFEQTKQMINDKGLVYVPIMYLLPLFPDDFICLCVGSMKMKWWLHMLFGAIGKAVGIATVVFGVSIIPKELFLPFTTDKIYNWLVLGAVLIVYISCLFKIARRVDKKLSAYLKARREKENEAKVN